MLANDYYPFGMLQPGRQYSATSSYRYGFNGKEMDNEVSGQGNQYDYGFRIYNPRIGRFLSVDPLTSSYPYYTPYQFAGNMPIVAIDLDGLEQYVVTYYKDQNNNTTKITVRAIFDNDGTILNQHVHKIGTTEDIAKGNVLVFEIKKEKNGKESMSVVENRNKVDGKLTTRESKIFKKTQANLEKEEGERQTLLYGTNKPKSDLYESTEFNNADTRTYASEFGIAPPPSVIENKNEKTVVIVEVFTKDPPGKNSDGDPLEWAKWRLKHNYWYPVDKKSFNADTLILNPVVHYNQKFEDPSTISQIKEVKRYKIPNK